MREETVNSRASQNRFHSPIEVHRCLQRLDLQEETKHRAWFQTEEGERRSGRIRSALRDLGPVCVAFGLYLSTRNDLLPTLDCLELASLPDAAEPILTAEVEDLISDQLGCSSAQAFLYFDFQPFASRLVSQSHAALLTDGSAVAVTLVRPDLRKYLDGDLQVLRLLKPAFTCAEWPDLDFEFEVAAFARYIRRQCDFLQQADCLETLALDARDFDGLRVQDVHRSFCTSMILTTDRNVGSPLKDELDHAEHLCAPDRYAMARQLWRAWLRQALLGRVLPIEPRADNISAFSSGQVSFESGSFCRASAGARKSLVEYLTAVLAENPDQACLSLLKQVVPATRNTNAEALRNSFRQATDFRRDEWQVGSRAQGLTKRLLLHWQLLHRHGYHPVDHLTSFYRGLFLMSDSCQKLTSEGDPLQEAAEELRVMTVVDRFRELPPLNDWKADFSRHAALMMELPRRFDDLLTLTADGSPGLRVKIDAPARPARKPGLSTLIALCLLLAVVATFAPGEMRQLANALGTERSMMLALWLLFVFVLLRSGL
jgi:predicted unusual protein kinase regulating ubiquinone biosynthesis (AarF/ABC1/UbiB family)